MLLFLRYSFLMAISFMVSCSQVTISPRTKSQIKREQPSVVLLSSIVDFREATGSWPTSRQDMENHDKKYANAWQGFVFRSAAFRSKDINKMVFEYWDHPDDAATGNKIDLNGYSGFVKFYKKDGRFVWKIK